MSGTDAASMQGFLDLLAPADRTMLLLKYADQLSTAEIGLVLGLEQATVTTRLTTLCDSARRFARNPPAACRVPALAAR